jgi:hypothetical protein
MVPLSSCNLTKTHFEEFVLFASQKIFDCYLDNEGRHRRRVEDMPGATASFIGQTYSSKLHVLVHGSQRV